MGSPVVPLQPATTGPTCAGGLIGRSRSASQLCTRPSRLSVANSSLGSINESLSASLAPPGPLSRLLLSGTSRAATAASCQPSAPHAAASSGGSNATGFGGFSSNTCHAAAQQAGGVGQGVPPTALQLSLPAMPPCRPCGHAHTPEGHDEADVTAEGAGQEADALPSLRCAG